ncbi:MAG: N-acetyltransferase [Lutibacter sp.]|nr:MAG: N-acetyltransferase [Lutibacter sp.]
MNNELIIRLANMNDLPSIVDIYNQAIRTKSVTGHIEEFSVNERFEWFEKFTPSEYPIYVAEIANKIVGYCTLSPYRNGRKAMSKIAEISFYLDYSFHGNNIGTEILKYVILDCKRIGKDNLLAILMDLNSQSIGILKKFNFIKWGHFPDIIDINGKKCGHLIYGLKINKSY